MGYPVVNSTTEINELCSFTIRDNNNGDTTIKVSVTFDDAPCVQSSSAQCLIQVLHSIWCAVLFGDEGVAVLC